MFNIHEDWKCIKKLNEKRILVSGGGGGIKKNEWFHLQRIYEGKYELVCRYVDLAQQCGFWKVLKIP